MAGGLAQRLTEMGLPYTEAVLLRRLQRSAS